MELVGIDLSKTGTLDAELKDLDVTRSQVSGYLDSGEVVLAARSMVKDQIDTALPDIPVVYMTDGYWVWSAEMAAYVARHGLGLPGPFLAYISENNGRVPSVSVDDRDLAARFLRQNP